MKLSEKGFTLLELLVALSIMSAIMGVMSAAVITIMKTTQQNEEWNVNMREMQNAGHWISQDALMAQTVILDRPNVFLALTWNDWNNNNTDVEYYFDQNHRDRLYRRLNHVSPGILIAQYVLTDNTSCTWNAADSTLTVNIKTSMRANGRFADGAYQIHPRPSIRGG